MNASVKGALSDKRSWSCFTHNGKAMTKEQVKAVLEYADSIGIETIYDIPINVIDEIIEKLK